MEARRPEQTADKCIHYARKDTSHLIYVRSAAEPTAPKRHPVMVMALDVIRICIRHTARQMRQVRLCRES